MCVFICAFMYACIVYICLGFRYICLGFRYICLGFRYICLGFRYTCLYVSILLMIRRIIYVCIYCTLTHAYILHVCMDVGIGFRGFTVF